jgi:hypothetical protein
MNQSGIRAKGGGRKSSLEIVEGLDEAFLEVIAEYIAGLPMEEGRKWTNLKRQEIAQLIEIDGKAVRYTLAPVMTLESLPVMRFATGESITAPLTIPRPVLF